MFDKGKRTRKVQQEIEKRISQLNETLSERTVSTSLKENLVTLRRLFEDMDLIKYRELTVRGLDLDCFLVYCDGMVSCDTINQCVIRPMMTRKVEGDRHVLDALTAQVIQVAETARTGRFVEIVEKVMSGSTALFVDTCPEALVLNTKDFEVRAIEEPENEKSLVGPGRGLRSHCCPTSPRLSAGSTPASSRRRCSPWDAGQRPGSASATWKAWRTKSSWISSWTS